MHESKSLRTDLFEGFLILVIWCCALSLVGCDTPSQFQGLHPKEAIVIEDVIEFMEKVAEKEAESVIHLPDGSLHIVFDHKLFVVPASTVAAAEQAGVVVPATTP